MSKQAIDEKDKQALDEMIKPLPDLPEKIGFWSGKVMTIVGSIELTQRAIFKSIQGDKSNHQIVDKQLVNGQLKAELRGIKVITRIRDNMLLDLRDSYTFTGDEKKKDQLFYAYKCRKNNLCGNCVACVSLGSLHPGHFSRRSRWFMPDMFSTSSAEDCIAGYENYEDAGVLNTVDTPMRKGISSSSRSSSSYATYEFVKPSTVFPFKIMIRDPSKYDILAALKCLNDVGQVDGIGAYSSRNGRFRVHITAIADRGPLNNASNFDLSSTDEWRKDPEKLFPEDAKVMKISDTNSLISDVYTAYSKLLNGANWKEYIKPKTKE